ncbi:amiloride-sensitive sodium channel subunit beta-like [Gigantopelta aegis]|uniref:amiloride-sensitive sodium channel subunit beta-like n=1 Tax=Gigantopelta aegis TaxID=1735272 RepID=UPI001B88D7DB|nr:amiloride-sensitive sodium channel subunit beta-like [Gigantopelta aegis]
MTNTTNWGFLTDMPGYSGHFSNFQEPPADYDGVMHRPMKHRPTPTVSSDQDDVDGDDADGNAKSLKRVLTRFAERTSMQGVPYILASKHPIAKLMWVIFLLLAMAAMFLHLYFLFSTFYSYQKQSQVLLGFSKLRFPAVTICNMNAVRRSRLKTNGSQQLKDFVDSVRPSQLVLRLKKKGHSGPAHPPGGGSQGPSQGGTAPTQNGTGQTGGGTGQTQGGTGQSRGDTGQSQGGTGQSQGGTGQSQGGTGQTEGGTGQSQGATGQSQDGTGQTQGGTGQSQGDTGQTQGGTGQTQGSTGQSGSGSTQSGSGTEQGQAGTGQNQGSTAPPWKRNKRFVDTLEFNFTNKRDRFLKKEKEFDEENSFFSGKRSSLRGIQDEFLYLLYQHPRNIRREMGHQIEDMLVDCSFDGIVCSDDDFKLVPSPTYGNCFTLENDLFVVRKNGPSHGLELILFLETQEFLRGISRGNGIVVQVHQPRTWAFPEDDGLYISTYQETNIAMRMKNIQRLGSPFGHCETGHHYRTVYNITYTRQTCQSICHSKDMYARCNCYDEKDEMIQVIENFTDEDFPRCQTDKEIECQMALQRQWAIGSIKCDCPNPCSENSYQRLLSSRNWPSDEYSLLLVESICKERSDSVCKEYTKMDMRQLNLNFLKLNIFFEDLNYENITEVPSYEKSQFLSDIGGTIGLWIGLSLLSIAEVGQFACEFFHYICYVKVKQTTRRKNRKCWENAAQDMNQKRSVVKSFFTDYGNSAGLGRKENPLPDRLSTSVSSSRRDASLF